MLKNSKYIRLCVVLICGLLEGCADFNAMERIGIIQMHLQPGKMTEAVQAVETVLKAHQFSKMDTESGRDESNMAVALQLMEAPRTILPLSKPQELRSTWVLLIDQPGTIPDKVLCSIYPTENQSVLQLSVTVLYPWRMPPLVDRFWHDLVDGLSQKYGKDSVTIPNDL